MTTEQSAWLNASKAEQLITDASAACQEAVRVAQVTIEAEARADELEATSLHPKVQKRINELRLALALGRTEIAEHAITARQALRLARAATCVRIDTAIRELRALKKSLLAHGSRHPAADMLPELETAVRTLDIAGFAEPDDLGDEAALTSISEKYDTGLLRLADEPRFPQVIVRLLSPDSQP